MIYEYWRSRLDDKAKKCYDILLEGAKVRKDRISCKLTKEKLVREAYFALIEDHPELFYLANEYSSEYFRLGPPGLAFEDVTVDMIYLYSDTQILKAKKEIDSHINTIRKKTCGMDDREKVIAAVEYVVELTTYEIDNEFNQNAASALYSKFAQCSGISKAVKLLLDSIDVPCLTASGEAYGSSDQAGPHAWCIVKINGRYYHIDPTFMLGSNTQKRMPLRKCWLFYDDKALANTHIWDRSIHPVCDDPSLRLDESGLANMPLLGNLFRNFSQNAGDKSNGSNAETDVPVFDNLRAFREFLKKQMVAREELVACKVKISSASFDAFRKYIKSAIDMVQNDLHFNSSISLESRSDGVLAMKIRYDI